MNRKVTWSYLRTRADNAKKRGFSVPKWVSFCREMLAAGFEVYLYEAKRTRSKYVTVTNGENQFKVRFSDHKPNKRKELRKDCDYFVGRTHTGVRTTKQAIEETHTFFECMANM